MRRIDEENLQGSSPPVLLIFNKGEFSLETGTPVGLSGRLTISALCEIIIDCLLALRDQFGEGFKMPIINQEPLFLDNMAPDVLGNSRSVWVGRKGNQTIRDDRWFVFTYDLLTEFLELRLDLINQSVPHTPPNIYKEDAQQAIEALLDEILETEKIQENVENKDKLKEKIVQLGRELHLRDMKIQNLKKELSKRSKPSKREKDHVTRGKDFDHPSHVKQHDHDLEIRDLIADLILNSLRGRRR